MQHEPRGLPGGRLKATFALGILGAIALFGGNARAADLPVAPSRDACVDANTEGQHLRMQQKLAAARTQFLSCANDACPGVVRADCKDLLAALESAQPTIVFDLRDATGASVKGVTVSVDSEPRPNLLDGAPLPVDPGPHTFTFNAAGRPAVTQGFVLKEGESHRLERVVMASVPAPPPPPPLQTPPAEPDFWTPKRTLGVGLASGGVAVLILASVTGVLARSAAHEQTEDCGSPTSCPLYSSATSEHSTASAEAVVSTIAFAAGGGLVAVGAWQFLVGAPSEPSPAPTALTVSPAVGPHGPSMVLSMRF